MALNETGKELNFKLIAESAIIVVICCAIGLIFNAVWKNKIPFFATSKTEVYAQKDVPTITLKEAKDLFDGGKYIFLDARNPEPYNNNHIKGALNLPVKYFDISFTQVEKQLAKDAKIVVYCESEECNASLLLWQKLSELKYANVKVFIGGWREWDKAGYPRK